MRSWDRAKPRSGLAPRLEQLQRTQLFQTVRGLRPDTHRPNTTFTTDAISANLRAFDNNNGSKLFLA